MNNSEIITVIPAIQQLPYPNSHPALVSRSITKKSVLCLFIFALALRMIYVIQSTDNPLFGVPVVDAYI